MKYQIVKSSGAWVDKASLKNGTRAKIISETRNEPSKFLNTDGSPKMQDNCKVQFEGATEAVNISLNRATLNALVEAYGEDSLNWMNKTLTVEVEKMRVAGKAVIALYLIPKGFKKIDDADGYAIIVPNGLNSDGTKVPDFSEVDKEPTVNVDAEEEDLPF